MGIVAAAPGSSLTVSSSDKDTLLHGLLGFYGNYSVTPYLNSVLQRAADFDKGFSTSGEVSTFLVAIGDKMLQLMQKYECGSDATRENRSKFWRIVLLRILRDHFSDTFTAFVEAGDADGDRKRQEKSMEADTFIEIMVQGLNFPTGKDGFVDSEMVMSFIHELGYGIANTELLDLGGISLENIDEAGISCGGEEEDDQCEFDAFFDSYEMDADILGGAEAESVPMHERDSSRDTSRSHMWFSPSNAHLQLSRGISGSMTLRNVVKVALQWHGRLGSRSGDPRLSQTDAEILAVPSDLARIALINRVVDSIEREVEIIVRAELHMKNLEATLSEITGVVCHDSPALIADSVKNAFFDLAGVTSTSEEALRWILSQILFAVELRANGEYRRQQTGGTELTSNAPLQPNTNESTSSTIGPGVMLLDADALILRLNKRISRKQSAAWIASEIVRKNKLKAQLTRVFLQHPQHLSPLPLVIYSPTHRDAISNWTNVHMGYDIVSAVHPITEKPTGMASNTFLTRRSKYFMQKCNPYEAIAVTFGTGEDRSLTEFCDHFHTFAFDTYLNTWELGSKSFYEFKNALKNRYGEKVDQYSILVIWVDCVFQKSLSNTFAETEAILKECSSFGTTTEDQDIILQELINNVKWYNKPGEFLDEYFSSKECYPHCIISIEDFAAYCERMGIVPSDFELSSFEASGQFASPKFLSVDRNEIHELIREVYSELSSTSL